MQAQTQDGKKAEEALAALCQRYWYPLFAWLRYQGYSPDRAEDLTQGFFARILEKKGFSQADPDRGRFRSFLITSLRNYIANEYDHQAATKRGGGKTVVSLDASQGESRLQLFVDHGDPQQIYERTWAMELLQIVMQHLVDDFQSRGKSAEFEILRPHLTGNKDGSTSYESAARSLRMSEEAVRQAVHRMRKRFRERLRAEVASTVSTEADIDDEIRSLFQALGS